MADPHANVVPLQVNVSLLSVTVTPVRSTPHPQLVTVADSLIVGLAQLAAFVQLLVTQIAGETGAEQVAEAVADTV